MGELTLQDNAASHRFCPAPFLPAQEPTGLAGVQAQGARGQQVQPGPAPYTRPHPLHLHPKACSLGPHVGWQAAPTNRQAAGPRVPRPACAHWPAVPGPPAWLSLSEHRASRVTLAIPAAKSK